MLILECGMLLGNWEDIVNIVMINTLPKTEDEQSMNHISRSPQHSWWGLVLAETCSELAQHAAGLSFFREMYVVYCLFLWQSCVEIKNYSVMCFDHITAFEVPYHWTSVKSGAHMRFVDLLDIHASTKHIWALPLMEVQRYDALNTAMRSKNTPE